MATSTVLSIEPLPSDADLIEDWVDRFQLMVSIHEAVREAPDGEKDNAKKALLLSYVGGEGYRLIKAYTAPDKPDTKTFDALIAVINDNLKPRTSAISESYKFAKLRQETGETLALYMGRVKTAASKCNYGNSFDRMVMDKFVHGLKSEKIRAHLLNDTTINTAALALEKALAM